MSNIKRLSMLLCVLTLSMYSLDAQNAPVASGQEASGTGGSLSASVGQLVYQSNTGSGGTLSEGLQQAYEIFLVSSNETIEKELNATVFPNPTTDQVRLQVNSQDWNELHYRLLDAQGKILDVQRLQSSQTEIDFQRKASGVYFIQLISDSQSLQTFKILKNQ